MLNLTLILLRHAESVWTHDGKFTGWSDVNLSEVGIEEEKKASERLKEFCIARIFTSVLQRSIMSAEIVCAVTGQSPPVESDWRLNERHYGALEGMSKKEATLQYGDETVRAWRRGYHTHPPPVERTDPRHPCHDSKYVQLTPDQLTSGESPEDVFNRVLLWYNQVLLPLLQQHMPEQQTSEQQTPDSSLTVLVVAHGTPLRMLMKLLEGTPEEEIEQFELPSAVPIVYNIRYNTTQNRTIAGKSILMDPDEFRTRQQQVKAQSNPKA
ncbi:bisphosphoglycerate mutase [Gregarina niphandrodes]|uniref:phosphoglycerate mutase (2,3-diphosphoglycerate-dependent) n=1 Tax=Gregarina niphandrodes TaxID=110365 RepID=A0A023BBQ4_GRENI|nr:bisphosphoglycerate mutase [Gregarina niphandrodes]EZG79710.1 bisphosphoglycerate mutase [Gregarina niphandrodes]|eukprot:XP_011134392.1 bisphosphoglycerate mutase [Gregarina niphandrodes]